MQSLVRVTFFASTVTPPVIFLFSTVAPVALTVSSPEDASDEHAADGPTLAYLGSGNPHAPGATKQPSDGVDLGGTVAAGGVVATGAADDGDGGVSVGAMPAGEDGDGANGSEVIGGFLGERRETGHFLGLCGCASLRPPPPCPPCVSGDLPCARLDFAIAQRRCSPVGRWGLPAWRFAPAALPEPAMTPRSPAIAVATSTTKNAARISGAQARPSLERIASNGARIPQAEATRRCSLAGLAAVGWSAVTGSSVGWGAVDWGSMG